MYFSDFHPTTLVIYFISIVALTMITMNPILLLLSFCGAVLSVKLSTKHTSLHIYLLFFLFIALSNPIFSHNGETVLFFLFDQRVTFEALFYGVAAAILLIGIIFWFKLFSHVFTEDKLTFLIGKISPKLCVIFTMALRFIPLVKENVKNIYIAQLSMSIFDTTTFKGKVSLIKNTFSALISLSVENAIETADVMRSRGFENTKRSSYSLVLYSKHDFIFTCMIIIADILITRSLISGGGEFYYYPAIKFIYHDISLYLSFGFLSFLPVLNHIKEELKWKYLISRI